MVRTQRVEEAVRTRLRPRRNNKPRVRLWLIYFLGRVLQVAGLMVTLVAATAFFGTPSITSMLKMMLAGVLLFLVGWLLARRNPGMRDGGSIGHSPLPRGRGRG